MIATFSADAVEFDCDFNFREMVSLGRIYGCSPTVTLTESIVLENVTGVHEPDLTHDDVELLLIENQNVPLVPLGIVNFFLNLRAIVYNNSNTTSLSAQDLEPFPIGFMFD